MSSYNALNTISVLPSSDTHDAKPSGDICEKDSTITKDAENLSLSHGGPEGDECNDDEVLDSARDLVTHVISIEDDPELNPWTFRTVVIGLGLSTFGGVLAEIYYFKPQTVLVSTMFLGIIAYVLGIAFETFIPTRGWFRYLNPGPFNKKENAMIVIMASAAASSSLATEVLAVQRLYYNIQLNTASSIFLLFSSQMIGYGIGGMLRPILLYPSNMLYPGVLPLVSMFDALYKVGSNTKKKLRLFYIVFFTAFVWELVPEWIFPMLTGFSIFCLANPSSADFTRVHGGTDANEGLGILSVCFDWLYISGVANPLTIPLRAQFSNLIGYVMGSVVFCAVFYNNIWKSRNFPFLSQELFYENGTVYDQLLILDSNFEVDSLKLAEQGLPFYAGSWVVQLICANMAMASTVTHLLLWNYSDLKLAWQWLSPYRLRETWATFDWRFWKHDGSVERGNLYRSSEGDSKIDPHYRATLRYADAPFSWYFVTLIVSAAIAIVLIYKTNSTLPWWGFLVSLLLGAIFILFLGALYAITGLQLISQPFVQMIGGFILQSGRPMANMYFVLFSYNSVTQSELLLRDLKIAQYTKLSPRAAFTAQITGTLLGSVLNFVLMNSIIDSQREILLSVEGTNVWSGQQAQQFNSQAIAWGGLSKELFTRNKVYQWVPWAYVIGLFIPLPFWLVHRRFPRLKMDFVMTPVICFFVGWLCVGINSSASIYFVIVWYSQWYLRTRHPRWFNKYNYILAAALDGGTQVMVFLLSFAVFGAGGATHLFPHWWGANSGGNYDRCLKIES